MSNFIQQQNQITAELYMDSYSWGNEILANLGGSTATVRGYDFLDHVHEAFNQNPVMLSDEDRDEIRQFLPQPQTVGVYENYIQPYAGIGGSLGGGLSSWFGADFETIMRTLAIVLLAILLIGLGIAGLLMTTETGRSVVKKSVEVAAV